ncbi:hypothetical protein IE81DRAFT_292760, partial [Ceraceosorus guamensis]
MHDTRASQAADSAKVIKSPKGLVEEALGAQSDSLDERAPLSSLGLDSLTAVKLSGLLKRQFGLSFTQMQLLGATTLRDIQASSEVAQPNGNSASNGTAKGSASLDSAADTCVVHLNDVTNGDPLFLIHGAGGSI